MVDIDIDNRSLRHHRAKCVAEQPARNLAGSRGGGLGGLTHELAQSRGTILLVERRSDGIYLMMKL